MSNVERYPQLRQSPLTGDRVIVAPARADRPQVERAPGERRHPPEYDPRCPFCPGNEAQAPRELFRIPDRAAEPDWRVRVVANKYPALVGGPPGQRTHSGALHTAEVAEGRHEVIVETRGHDRGFPDLGADAVLEVMQAYRARFAAAAGDERIRHVVIFRNQGPMANASIEHPHSQLAGLTFLPPLLSGRLERSNRYADRVGRPLLVDLVEDELAHGARVIEATNRFAVFVPFAPTYDYEIWVAPRSVPPRFDRVEDETLSEFGQALSRALAAMDRALGNPDYNFVLQTPPLLDGAEAVLPWHCQIIPRRYLTAGFEMGVGVHILVTTPEEAAARLREAAS